MRLHLPVSHAILRTVLGLRALPSTRGAAPVAARASGGMWRRLLSSEASQTLSRRTQWQATARSGAKRPTMPRHSPVAVWRTQTRQRGFRFSAWTRSSGGGKPQEALSLGARFKKLSRKYGWAAVGVYLGLSVLDFPFCFLLVRIVGTETIGKVEHYVVSTVASIVPESTRQTWREYWRAIKRAEAEQHGDKGISDKVKMAGWGVQEAQERHEEEASLATQLALAYAIHKSFIFVRVPLTAAVTPKVVKVLRSWGWNIGKRGSR